MTFSTAGPLYDHIWCLYLHINLHNQCIPDSEEQIPSWYGFIRWCNNDSLKLDAILTQTRSPEGALHTFIWFEPFSSSILSLDVKPYIVYWACSYYVSMYLLLLWYLTLKSAGYELLYVREGNSGVCIWVWFSLLSFWRLYWASVFLCVLFFW